MKTRVRQAVDVPCDKCGKTIIAGEIAFVEVGRKVKRWHMNCKNAQEEKKQVVTHRWNNGVRQTITY